MPILGLLNNELKFLSALISQSKMSTNLTWPNFNQASLLPLDPRGLVYLSALGHRAVSPKEFPRIDPGGKMYTLQLCPLIPIPPCYPPWFFLALFTTSLNKRKAIFCLPFEIISALIVRSLSLLPMSPYLYYSISLPLLQLSFWIKALFL